MQQHEIEMARKDCSEVKHDEIMNFWSSQNIL